MEREGREGVPSGDLDVPRESILGRPSREPLSGGRGTERELDSPRFIERCSPEGIRALDIPDARFEAVSRFSGGRGT